MTGLRLAAVTGATGFLGRHLIAALAAEGFRVRALVRRDPASPFWRGLHPELVLGDLSDAAALRRLTEGAEVVLHLAGATKAVGADGFMTVNRDGASRVAEAAGPARLVMVSSLAAREPALSAYAASKRAGEEAVAEVVPPDRLTIVRPPAIYGPGDPEFLPLFKAARGPLVPLLGPPRARFAMIHVEDAARQIAFLAKAQNGGIIALSDANPAGYSWRQAAEFAAEAVGGRPLIVQAPPFAGALAGAAADFSARLSGRPMVFSSDKVREMRHPDWGIAPHEQRNGLPQPKFDLLEGFRQTVSWATTSRLI